jgi:hypothetical protein
MGRSVYHAPNTVDGVYLIPTLEEDSDHLHVWYNIIDDIANAMRFPDNDWHFYPFIDGSQFMTNEHIIIARIDKHELYVTLSEYGGAFALSIVYYGERPLSKKRAAYVKAQMNRFKKGLKTYYKAGTFSNGEAVFYPHSNGMRNEERTA